MVRHSCFVVGAAALTACSGGTNNDAGPREGQYQQTVKINDLAFPGMTDAERTSTIAQMEGAAGGGTGGMFCMSSTPGEGQGWKDAVAEMANSLGGRCVKTKEQGSATSLELEMTCTGTPKGDVAVKSKLAATSESYGGTMAFDVKDPASGETARVAMRIDAKRQGDCPN